MKTLVKVNLEIALVCSEEEAHALFDNPEKLIKGCFEKRERYLLDYEIAASELMDEGIDVAQLLEQRKQTIIASDEIPSDRSSDTPGQIKLI